MTASKSKPAAGPWLEYDHSAGPVGSGPWLAKWHYGQCTVVIFDSRDEQDWGLIDEYAEIDLSEVGS